MATAPTLYWYQLDSGTLSATYFGQLNTTVAALCSENAVTAPTAPWQNSIGGTLFSKWQTQVDVAVRALCTALSVTEPIPLARGSNAGQYQSEYLESLDGVVRLLCAVPSYEGPLDLVPGAVVAYGQRALSAAKLGSALYTIREEVGNTTQSFSSDAVTGAAPSASIATFIGAPFIKTGAVSQLTQDIVLVNATGVCIGQHITGADIPADTFVIDISSAPTITISANPTGDNVAEDLTFTPNGWVATWVDQSASGKDAAQATAINQPMWAANIFGTVSSLLYGDPYGIFVGGASRKQLLTTGSITLPDGEYTIFGVFMFTAALDLFKTGINAEAISGAGEYIYWLPGDDATNGAASSDGDGTASNGWTSTQSTYRDVGVIYDAAWSFTVRSFRINNAVVTADPSGNSGDVGSIAGPLAIGFDDAVDPPGNTSRAYVAELLIYNGIMSDADRLALRTNIATYYGITLS